MPLVDQLFSEYGTHLCAALWEVHKALRDSSKFRDFAVHAKLDRQCGDRSLFELLTVPVGRIAQYAILFDGTFLLCRNFHVTADDDDGAKRAFFAELAKASKNASFIPTVNEMRKLSFEMAGSVDNCAQLILMLVHVADIPHPVRLDSVPPNLTSHPHKHLIKPPPR